MFEEKNEKKIEARNGQIGLVWELVAECTRVRDQIFR
jgi:hypothetical protein